MGIRRWHLGRAWSQILYDYPVPIFILSIVLTGVLPLISLYFNRVILSENAEVGFDTSNTEYSGQRQAWKKLSFVLQTTNRVTLGSNTTSVQKRETFNAKGEPLIMASHAGQNRKRRGWTDNLMSAFTNIPCYEAPLPLNRIAHRRTSLGSFDF
ncbi:unnamed protein product, partial [Mesorhabditis spiculigera]